MRSAPSTHHVQQPCTRRREGPHQRWGIRIGGTAAPRRRTGDEERGGVRACGGRPPVTRAAVSVFGVFGVSGLFCFLGEGAQPRRGGRLLSRGGGEDTNGEED